MTKKEILLKQRNAENAPLTNYIGTDGYVWKMIENAMEEYHQSKLKSLGIGDVSISDLTEILKSDSVYTILRFGFKSPSKSGMDDCDDNDYSKLYRLVCELRKH